MKIKNIIQFMPYFPPHFGGVEKVGEDIFLKWTYGKSIVFSGEIEDNSYVYNDNGYINIDSNIYIGYPAFDIVDNFPFPLIWTRKYRNAIKELTNLLERYSEEEFYVITHTRFFLSSFLGGRFAKKHKLKWIHVEHGSDYVKLSSSFKNKIAYLYDKTLGNYVFKKADKILSISNASKIFVEKEFGISNVDIWYRGIDISEIESKKNDEIKIVFIGRLVHLKGVDTLLRAYAKGNIKPELIIFGDGEENEELQKLSGKLGITNRVKFTGFIESANIIHFLSENKCILVNPSYQEGMPTTVIEALATKNIVIATDVGGTKEISNNEDLILFKSGNIEGLTRKIGEATRKYSDLEGKSYTHIYEKFSWDKSLEKLNKYLD